MIDLEKCTMQFVLSVRKKLKYHSNQTAIGQFTAENAINHKESQDISHKILVINEVKRL